MGNVNVNVDILQLNLEYQRRILIIFRVCISDITHKKRKKEISLFTVKQKYVAFPSLIPSIICQVCTELRARPGRQIPETRCLRSGEINRDRRP